MSLFTCPECKKKISDKAASCPNCGCVITNEIRAKQKRKNGIGCLFFVILIGCLFVYVKLAMDENKNAAPLEIKTEALTPESIRAEKDRVRAEKVSKLFDPWNGAPIKLTEHIKGKLMHDPESYKHIETVYEDKVTHVLIKTSFHGKNALGGVVRNSVTAKVDIDGNIVEIISTK
jgi:hypothetical protein